MSKTKSKPKILFLACGGTIAMSYTSEGFLAPDLSGQEILDRVPEIASFVDVDVEEVFNIDSTNIQPHHWATITKTISDNYDKYDGFVITHGTDTLSYSASALSFSLQNLNKPIILTGAMKTFDKIPSDISTNLINAFRVATMDIAEVCVVFGTKIIRGCRATKKGEMTLDAFHSKIIEPIGRVDIDPILYSYSKKKNDNHKLICKSGFNPNIMYFKIVPGINPSYLLNDVDMCDGIILESTASGNVPSMENSLIPVIKKAHSQQKPVVITVHGQKGGMMINNYEPSVMAMEAGAIPAKDMTTEAATTKLMWALANSDSYEDIRKIITTNIAGEIS